MNSHKLKTYSEDQWKFKTDKINTELFVMTYGSLVVQLIDDYENYDKVNEQLDKMGYGIGIRLIEDFLANNPKLNKCQSFKESCEVIAKVGFKIYLDVTPEILTLSDEECTISLTENPLENFVQLPKEAFENNLLYSNVLIGVLRGSLESVGYQCKIKFLNDRLLQNNKENRKTEINIKFDKVLDEQLPLNDD